MGTRERPGVARAIWKGRLVVGRHDLPVKMYSAVQDTQVHFRLLDRQSLEPVHQRIVRKADGQEVPKEEQRKAFPIEKDRAVVLTPEELEDLAPKASRDIELLRFVPPSLLDAPWYERPYYLGPDEDEKSYFALVEALEKRSVLGIARWVMRQQRYLGALSVLGGYLTLVTLRRAEQVLAVPQLEPARKADEKELRLAEQLVDAIAEDFNPGLWQDEYHERVCKLIEEKAHGKKVELRRPKPKRPTGELAEELRRSLASVKERRVA